MKYQIIEKEIYSEADLLHFGENYEIGELINEHFPDYCGVPLGDIIFEGENIEEVKEKKKLLEIKRLKILNGGINGFFDDDEYAERFFSSENFNNLKELYKTEFNLKLIRKNHNQMVVKENDFYYPREASDEQMMRIQQLLGIYFFEIREKY